MKCLLIFSAVYGHRKKDWMLSQGQSVNSGSFNKQITIFAALTTANLVVMKIEQKDQALRIRKLEKEIEELKRPEGE